LFGKTILGIFEGDAVAQLLIPQLIEWWKAGLFPFDKLVERFPLSEIDVVEGRAASGEVIKPVLIPGG
ncbi:MAG: NAD(P)-dependent alcohol dehydrogenase, partial [Nocardia sp.]|nr:NAD(P)-dependent alcohol dehydrogenase [Nocardia sp.]